MTYDPQDYILDMLFKTPGNTIIQPLPFSNRLHKPPVEAELIPLPVGTILSMALEAERSAALDCIPELVLLCS